MDIEAPIAPLKLITIADKSATPRFWKTYFLVIILIQEIIHLKPQPVMVAETDSHHKVNHGEGGLGDLRIANCVPVRVLHFTLITGVELTVNHAVVVGDAIIYRFVGNIMDILHGAVDLLLFG